MGLRNLALADHHRLEWELKGALAVDWKGSLTWSEYPADSERLVTEHTAWGYGVRLVERDEIGWLEPRLVAPPPVAAFAPGDACLTTTPLIARLPENGRVSETAMQKPCPPVNAVPCIAQGD